MICTIKNEGLVKVFDIDGKTVYPSAYMTYAPLQEDFDEMKQHGVNVFMFGIYAGDEGINMESGLRPLCNNFFKGYGEYDFSAVEKVMNMIDPTGEEEVYVIPRVCLEPPKWWQKLNPDEVGCDYTGQPLRYCFTSEKWRKDMSEALFALIDYFENSKWKNTVIGYHIAAGGTEEWTYQCRYDKSYYEYSQRNLEAYQRWLEDKYTTCSNLSKVWGRKVSAWDEVKFPNPASRTYAKKGFLRNPDTEMDVLDYYDFHNESVADTINYFCKQVKDYTNNTRVTGAFYGYVAVLPQNKKGLHALHKLLEQPYVDFISTTNWYKEEGGAWVFASAVHSALLHDKMWIAEGDLRTSKSTNLGEYLPEALPDNDYYTSAVWRPLATMEQSESVLTKGLARIITAPCGIWWFGMFGRWFSDERMMRIIDKTSSLLAKQQHDYLKTDVAVIIDEKAYKYYGIPELRMRDVIDENMKKLSYVGFTYHNYLLSDIKNNSFPADDYKMYIFVGCVNPSEEEKDAINKKLKNGNKTLMWLHSASYYDSDLSGFKLEERDTDITGVIDFDGKKYCDAGTPYGEDEYSLPCFKFADCDGYVLSRFDESREPAVIWRNMDGYSSVYSITMAPSVDIYRHIAIMSGVHLYNRDNDCVYAGGEFAGIYAMTEGYKRIALPYAGFKASNAITGEPLKVNSCFIDIYMKQYESILVHIEKEDE